MSTSIADAFIELVLAALTSSFDSPVAGDVCKGQALASRPEAVGVLNDKFETDWMIGEPCFGFPCGFWLISTSVYVYRVPARPTGW